MKSLRLIPTVLFLTSLSTLAFAQSDPQKSFDKLKTLAGSWQGSATTEPPQDEMPAGTMMQLSLRVTSRGNALVHEMREAGKARTTKNFNPSATMIFLE